MTNNKYPNRQYPGTAADKWFDRILFAIGWIMTIATIVIVVCD
jgi:hypothetical protein